MGEPVRQKLPNRIHPDRRRVCGRSELNAPPDAATSREPVLNVLITGAAGFVGQALVREVRTRGFPGIAPVTALTLLDNHFPDVQMATDQVRQVQGSLADRDFVHSSWGEGFDVVCHLASIPGGAAEQNYELSRDVNINGTTWLLEAAKAQTERGGRKPKFVFASTIAVFGSSLPPVVDDDSAVNPKMTYASQKLIGETLVADFSRREWVTLPSLRFSMKELVEAIALVYGGDIRDLVRYEPNPLLEDLFGRFPELRPLSAHRLGFQDDGDVATLVRRATENVEG